MARNRRADYASAPFHKTLTFPAIFLVRMAMFLTLVGFIVAIIYAQLVDAIMTNPALNGLIIAVLFFGILYSFSQVLRLYPEIRWVNAFRIADPGLAVSHKPVLLAPMATMLRDRTGAVSLSTASMSSIMDSIGSRLDEARDTGRYLVGLLVFLGLLGTFWGLLETIRSVGTAISAIDTGGDNTGKLFGDLKAGLAAPLQGMGTAFSSSLLGLAGSLVLGFLELQASHAQNRFYNELEEWLSGITELTPGSAEAGYDTNVNRQLVATLYDVQRALETLGQRMGDGAGQGVAAAGAGEETVKDLARGVNQLVSQMRAEQKVVREWVDEQAAQQSLVTETLRDLAQQFSRRGG
ncbi:MAG: flagellar motor protein MotA [Hyphomicrobiaceae bacterium]|nr:flagellar motor protein MotA [Hyphomicrobiaceae bacterium]